MQNSNIVTQFLRLRAKSGVTLETISLITGMSVATFWGWRHRSIPLVTNLDKAGRAIGYKLVWIRISEEDLKK